MKMKMTYAQNDWEIPFFIMTHFFHACMHAQKFFTQEKDLLGGLSNNQQLCSE